MLKKQQCKLFISHQRNIQCWGVFEIQVFQLRILNMYVFCILYLKYTLLYVFCISFHVSVYPGTVKWGSLQ